MTAQGSTDVNVAIDDVVNHPKHYNTHPSGIECVEYLELLPGNLAHVCVYVWRHEHKGRPIEDLEKALWFLRREVRRSLSEQQEATKFLQIVDRYQPGVRAEERLRPLQPFIEQQDFVACAVEALLTYEVTQAIRIVEEHLAELKERIAPP